MKRLTLALAGLVGLLGLLAVWLGQNRPVDPGAVPAVTSLLGNGGDNAGFLRAGHPGEIRWPEDYGPHPGYRSEWWYFTGSLSNDAGREFGFQLTFFRYGVQPPVEKGVPGSDLYMAHFAVTDRSAAVHRVVQRFARPLAGVVGARAEPFEVWLDDWSVRGLTGSFLPMQLSAADIDAGIAIDLQLGAGKPPVLQGDRGLSRKGDEPGNASWYFSHTRLPASGTVGIDGDRFTVSGDAWFDREWSTSSLGDAVGWDWFGLQLDDGRELMLYILRDARGEALSVSAGSLVDAGGALRRLARDEFRATVTESWRSPASGVEWPVGWRIELAGEPVLLVQAVIPDQEQNLAVRYWEGAVDVLAADDARRIGRGYMELTGYGQP